jgi:hypothetical protein
MYSKFTPTCFGKWVPSSGGHRCLRSYSSSVRIVGADEYMYCLPCEVEVNRKGNGYKIPPYCAIILYSYMYNAFLLLLLLLLLFTAVVFSLSSRSPYTQTKQIRISKHK